MSGLALRPLRRATRIADIGSGAGFPGLALAVALPESSVDLIESAGRKCAVIERLAAATGVPNARAVHARVEEWAAGEGREAYEAVTARAVGSPAVVVEYAAPLLRRHGVLVAWRGARDPLAESAGVAAARQLGLALTAIVPVAPFAGAHSRHLHVYAKVGSTPKRFPRRVGAAVKRPLR